MIEAQKVPHKTAQKEAGPHNLFCAVKRRFMMRGPHTFKTQAKLRKRYKNKG